MTKTYKPIESHYHPYHRKMDLLLSPARMSTLLSTIPETPEELQRSRSVSVGSSSTKSKKAMTRNVRESAMDLQEIVPAVRNLDLSDTTRLLQTRTLLRETNKRNITSQPEDSLMEVDAFPPSPPVKSSKRPSAGNLESPQAPRKRRRADRIDIYEDEEHLIRETPIDIESSRFFDTSFSTVNRRRSVRLGDLPGSKVKQRFPSLLSEDGLAQMGHDGPLISKKAPNSALDPQSESSKYSFPTKFIPSTASLSRAAVLIREIEDVANATNSTPPIPSLRRRTSSNFDWEESLLNAEDSLENPGFRSARSFAESMEQRRFRKTLHERRGQASGDLSDSIRTALG